MVEYGPTHVDNTDAISMELAAQQAAKSFALTVYFSKPGSPLRRPAEGQVGFIRTGERIPNSPGGKPRYAVTPATAKRCLWKDNLVAVLAHAYLPWEKSSFVCLRFSDFNWRQTLADRVCIRGENPDNPMYCDHGIDICRADKSHRSPQASPVKLGHFRW
jgi:hypothetical protein